jgi:hypothetical protein
MVKLILKQGEAKTLTLTVRDRNGGAADLTGATLLLGVKKSKSDAAYTISKEDAAFDKSQAATGIVKINLTATDTDQIEGVYVGELKCSWAGPPAVVDKSADFYLQINQTVTDLGISP